MSWDKNPFEDLPTQLQLQPETYTDETVRAHRHHEVFLAMLKLTLKEGAYGWRDEDVEACRAVADRAYPKTPAL